MSTNGALMSKQRRQAPPKISADREQPNAWIFELEGREQMMVVSSHDILLMSTADLPHIEVTRPPSKIRYKLGDEITIPLASGNRLEEVKLSSKDILADCKIEEDRFSWTPTVRQANATRLDYKVNSGGTSVTLSSDLKLELTNYPFEVYQPRIVPGPEQDTVLVWGKLNPSVPMHGIAICKAGSPPGKLRANRKHIVDAVAVNDGFVLVMRDKDDQSKSTLLYMDAALSKARKAVELNYLVNDVTWQVEPSRLLLSLSRNVPFRGGRKYRSVSSIGMEFPDMKINTPGVTDPWLTFGQRIGSQASWNGVLLNSDTGKPKLLVDLPKLQPYPTPQVGTTAFSCLGKQFIRNRRLPRPTETLPKGVASYHGYHVVAKGVYTSGTNSHGSFITFTPFHTGTPKLTLSDNNPPAIQNRPMPPAITTTESHVWLVANGSLFLYDREWFEGETPDPEPRIYPMQSTLELAINKPNRITYRADGATKFKLQLTLDTKSAFFEMDSTDGEFEVDLTDHLDALQLSVGKDFIEAQRTEEATKREVGQWISAQRKGLALATGVKTAKVPVEIKALLTAESSDGAQSHLLHSYYVLLPTSKIKM